MFPIATKEEVSQPSSEHEICISDDDESLNEETSEEPIYESDSFESEVALSNQDEHAHYEFKDW